eukprot:TRINITY_DN6087_c0_g1_i1.p1 TRINITY_DN6087_c0_g1~~TRINITY_DN6087_c0_g1_i1.p1  ORF type:complete len:327 (+),score=46.51 TRINITY_DN6087_c0_g1_i1:193-1173(+)
MSATYGLFSSSEVDEQPTVVLFPQILVDQQIATIPTKHKHLQEFGESLLLDDDQFYKLHPPRLTTAWNKLFSGSGSMPTAYGISLDSDTARITIHGNIDDGLSEEDEDDKPELLEILEQLNISNNSIALVPRGLHNKDTKCFLNSVLQSLVHCSPFYNFLEGIYHAKLPKQHYPYLRRFRRLFRQFYEADRSERTGESFTPHYFYTTLYEFNPISSTWQEDAQEYFSFLMNRLHGELLIASGESEMKQHEPGWQTRNRNGRIEVLEEGDSFTETTITSIFRGTMKNVTIKQTQRSTSSSQPFYCLHLDISVYIINRIHSLTVRIKK